MCLLLIEFLTFPWILGELEVVQVKKICVGCRIKFDLQFIKKWFYM